MVAGSLALGGLAIASAWLGVSSSRLARWPSKYDRGYNGYLIRREDRALLFGGGTAYTLTFSRLPRLPVLDQRAYRRGNTSAADARFIFLYAGFLQRTCGFLTSRRSRVGNSNQTATPGACPSSELPAGQPLERFEVLLLRARNDIVRQRRCGRRFVPVQRF